jgi:DNA-binding CsgD family transcriptional regulator
VPENYINVNNDEPKEQKVLQTFLSNISINKLSKGKMREFQQLTSRQKECLQWVCMGKTAEEIGIILGCSQRTVEAHINNIKIKLDCTRITQIIYLAIKHGLIDKYI